MDSIRMGSLGYVLGSIWREDSNRGQRIRRVLMFFGWQLWKRTFRTSLNARLFNGFRFRVRPDCDASPGAFYYAVPNSRHIALLRKYLHGGTFVDVGANVGLVTLLVADRIGHAILFEPSPVASKAAEENLLINKLPYEVFPVALSDKAGSVEFENAGASSCNRTLEGIETSLPTIRVQRTTFDRFLQERSGPLPTVDAVKIDVEGHENAVLRGMKEFLRHQRPKIVMFEYLGRTDIRQTFAIFQEVRYSVFELATSGARRVAEPIGVKPLQDLFACPSEDADNFGI
jgi:FkbM family methyltransferase